MLDVRFPTSRTLDGSDAVHLDPDYSCAYVVLRTDDGPDGHGLTFTIGRGTEVVVEAVRSLAPFVTGRDTAELFGDLRGFWRQMVGDSQLRWIGPEKGAIHLAGAAIVNAVWDLYAKASEKPLWKLLADMSPRELVDVVDFTYITDAITPDEALDLLRAVAPGKQQREAQLRADGYPAYVTSVGWMGYDDAKVERLCHEALADGWTSFKMKVGGDPAEDARRAALIRGAVGDEHRLMMDANQRWDVDEAIDRVKALAEFNPFWIEEPTSPDDVLGHAAIAKAVAPIAVATGEHAHNRVMFKQLMQANAIGFCQIDSCRLGGVNEVIAVLLMAAKFGISVCPHAGGVGLCEYVQHLSAFDYIAVSASLDNRMTEYAEHLHEHFVAPIDVQGGRYMLPLAPGYSAEMRPESLAEFAFPAGACWR
ncbi:MAG: fuconate dehydratase [Actinobacteria bacterium]|nr:fuconate dehydratase [Actinomycetota bacterium]MBV9932715.1 fuconate dehydratase [Actinomycetota bacterium]